MLFFWTFKEKETWKIILSCLQHNDNNNNFEQHIFFSFEITGINYILKYNQIENSYFK